MWLDHRRGTDEGWQVELHSCMGYLLGTASKQTASARTRSRKRSRSTPRGDGWSRKLRDLQAGFRGGPLARESEHNPALS